MTRARDILYPPAFSEVITPTKLCDVDDWDELTSTEQDRLKCIMRANYNRAYYRQNRERAKQWQRDYNLKHKRKSRGLSRHARFLETRESVQRMFTPSDIMQSSMGRTALMINQILDGTRGLVV